MIDKQIPKSNIPIDLTSALERTGDDEEFLYELIDLYMEDYSTKKEQLQKAIDEKNFDMLRELGHSLKGSSANLSLLQLEEASFNMELAGKDEDIEKAKSALSSLDREFSRLEDFLSNEKAQNQRI